MADLQGIGNLLQGMGAGFAGFGPQHAQAQAIQQETAFLNDERRRKALIRDFATVYSLGSQGNWDSATKLLENRVQHIQTLKGDPSDTLALLNTIKAGRTDEALSELGAFMQAGVLAGDIDAGRGNSPSQFSGMNMMTDGQRMFMVTGVNDPNTGQVSPSVVAVDGSGVAPQGPLQLVNNIGLTANQIPGQKGAEAYATADARGNAGYQWAGPIAGAEAQARANVEAATAPKIAADTTAAQEEAKADVGRDTQSRITERSGRALNAAADLVMAAFEDVNTGPVWGRVPAAMRDATAYQTAEGAAGQYRAQMRKIIRPPGSGPWTDLDEQKLDQIVPNLQDTREAVAAKIAQGRALYDAQVGGAQGNASNAPRETPRRRSTDTPNVVNWDDL